MLFCANHGKVPFIDQDALNFLLQKHIKFLPAKFNYIPINDSEIGRTCSAINAIIHFAGPKPWDYHCSPYDWIYWKYFSMTPWGDSIESLLDAQQMVGIDLGYALQIGRVASRKSLLRGIRELFKFSKF